MLPATRWHDDVLLKILLAKVYNDIKSNYCWRYTDAFSFHTLSNSTVPYAYSIQIYLDNVIYGSKPTYAPLDKCGYDLWNIRLALLLNSVYKTSKVTGDETKRERY